jgi:hypothetical protein
MKREFGPVAVHDQFLEIHGTDRRRVRIDDEVVLIDGATAQKVIPVADLRGPIGLSLPTRTRAWGSAVELLGLLVPAGGTEAEPTQIAVTLAWHEWGQTLYRRWQLGRPAEAPYPKDLARGLGYWFERASALSTHLLIDGPALSAFMAGVLDSGPRVDLEDTFRRATESSPPPTDPR